MRLGLSIRSTPSRLALLAAFALPGGQALAQDAQALHLRALAATCANCHGTEGRAVAGSALPALAGMPASYLVEQMRAFKAGARPATVMHQIAKGFTEAQIDQMAAYFAAQPR